MPTRRFTAPWTIEDKSRSTIPRHHEHRLQTRLQVATDNFLGDTVSDRWNAQRARSAIHFRNIHASHRRRKVAP